MKRRFGHNDTNNKFGAKKVVFKGIEFDSTHERDFYIKLLGLQRARKISGLRLQTPFLLITKTVKLVPTQLKTKVRWDKRVVEQEALYHNDFTYFDHDKNVYVCCEYKSQMTSKLPDYVLRRKLMVKKIYEHNAKGRSQWVFREVIYYNKYKTEITDK